MFFLAKDGRDRGVNKGSLFALLALGWGTPGHHALLQEGGEQEHRCCYFLLLLSSLTHLPLRFWSPSFLPGVGGTLKENLLYHLPKAIGLW